MSRQPTCPKAYKQVAGRRHGQPNQPLMASTSTTRRTGALLASQYSRSIVSNTSRTHALTRSRAAGPSTSVRRYASVGSTTFLGVPPPAPGPNPLPRAPASPQPTSPVKPFDANILCELQNAASEHPDSSTDSASASGSRPSLTPLTELVEQYLKREGRVLGAHDQGFPCEEI